MCHKTDDCTIDPNTCTYTRKRRSASSRHPRDIEVTEEPPVTELPLSATLTTVDTLTTMIKVRPFKFV